VTLDLLLKALRFDDASAAQFDAFNESDWRELLEAADREHLTLALGLRSGPALPDFVRSRIAGNLTGNVHRFELAKRSYEEIASALHKQGIEFAVLKGFSHWPCYTLDPRHRPQYDLDLLCPRHQVMAARDALRSLRYEPLHGTDRVPLDHLPAMIRKTGWQWRGDYFDPGIPLAIELHFRLWDAGTERIPLAGLDEFWDRRTLRRVEDFSFPALDRVDTLAYAALHLVRHLFRGDFRLYHAYEIAHFLEQTRDDIQFWRRWDMMHSDSLRAIQAIGFRLATEWFGCRVPARVREEFDRAPEPVQRWFAWFGMAPVEAKIRPNKSELWLHLSLLKSAADRRSVMSRRLLPTRRHKAIYMAHVPDAEVTWKLRATRIGYQARFTMSRIAYHARSAPPTLIEGLRWWWAGKDIHAQFPRFLAAASLFNFGMSVFFLLYNLLLARRGFHEDLVGAVASAMSVGSIAGTLPAAFVLHRFGLRKSLLASFLGVALVCAVRTLVMSKALLIGSAFCGGFLFSIYAVALAPTVAQLTTDRSRPFGFSLVFSAGIGIGVIAGFAGGRLPSLLARAPSLGAFPLESALLVSCGIAALGAMVASTLELRAPSESARHVYPKSAFLKRFLFVLLIWNLATGAFNPFFNLYFANNLAMPISQIGAIFSAAQMVQVIAVLSAPVVLKRLGVISGVMSMQVATALALCALSLGPPGFLAASIYAGYMGFQYMSEPGIYSLLMDRVEPRERGGASAMNFLVIFGGQAIAAAVSGLAVHRFGYAPVLAVAAGMAAISGLMFRLLLTPQSRSSIATTSLRNLSTRKSAS
jgi:MFS family permease